MIRVYEASDLEDLLDVWMAASLVAHPFLTADFLASERENIPKLYLPNAETWIDEAAGRVVGFIALIGAAVGALFVHPSQQRRGIGRRLMNKAKALYPELEVDVFTANPIGRAFYAKNGFQPVKESVHEPTGQRVMRLRFAPKRGSEAG
ncbi:putative N-acetyltransferase YjaB [Botrimarina colliarenosi]|uniref:Putative N-acetyltransferase YjaB n=1 Tax=Botrimarina colliarenosi TaxID=2528001 RepID=A0A5C6AJJ3_9BACT|nr:GNAT family N-acetyltransferase [Botrimarina colliarenosi]TWT99657.1 putative N-acetyltransferase YjaB [Botrimarina colliarenosi]